MEKEKQLDRLKTLFSEDKESRTEAIDISRDIIYLVNNALEGASNPRLSKAVAIGSAAYTLGVAAHKFYKLYKRSNAPQTYVIKITEDDAIFEIVENWLMDALPEEDLRSIYAHSSIIKGSEQPKRRGRRGSDILDDLMPAQISTEDDKSRVIIGHSFDGTVVQTVTIADHSVEIYTNVPENRGMMVADGSKGKSWNSRSINIVCKSVEARTAVLKEIENQSQHIVESQPRMYVTSRWGDWRRRAEIQPRSRDSVILKEGQMERILDYLNGFISNREAFKKVDIPFRTGILLYGEPGSGKSSTALAIANELKMNVYIVSLTSLISDEALNDAFSSIPANSIIILEDIDIASAVKDRDKDDDAGVTMTGMLNVLDGFQSPPGVITIMTTNRKDVLDDAIIRPGRVDLMETLGCLDTHQLRGLCKYFMGYVPENLPNIVPEDGISSAEVMGVVRKHMPDFENAGDDVVKFIEDKILTKLEA
jgi:hypothetical protein